MIGLRYLVTPGQQITALKKMLLWVPTEQNGRIIRMINKISQEQLEDLKNGKDGSN